MSDAGRSGDPGDRVDRFLRALCDVALERRGEYDRLDDVAGDGDMGTTLARGAVALIDREREGDAPAVLRQAAETVTAAMGGSSGPLIGVGLLRAADALDEEAGDAGMVRSAIDGIREYGEADRGDKTALDALFPLADALEGGDDPAAAAREGADATAEVAARHGRAAYAGDRSKGAMDPGAVCVAQVVEKLRGELGEIATWEELRERRSGARIESDEEAAVIAGFVGSAEHFVSESLDGFAAAHSDLVSRLAGHQVIVRRHGGDPPRRVAVLSGGGAGHEPMHAGFVGEGMLDAACPGAVFTSPSPDGIRAATEAVDAGAGVLHIVKQYTGDVLNFRLAAEIAAASGTEVATVIVDDDVAIAADSDVGRRGTGVTIVAEKIAGAAAAEGQGLHEVAALARRVVQQGRSYGVAIHGDEMEIGVGIHGEPGVGRVDIEPVDRIADRLLEPILAELDPQPETSLLVLLSGLGGTPPLQLYVLFEHLRRELDSRGLAIARSLVGDLITSLEQAGAVLSIVVLDDELERLWDAPARTPALSFG